MSEAVPMQKEGGLSQEVINQALTAGGDAGRKAAEGYVVDQGIFIGGYADAGVADALAGRERNCGPTMKPNAVAYNAAYDAIKAAQNEVKS